MKSVLISIKPRWCELIFSGKKTAEVRKSRPKLKTPFKVYIYCTKDFKPNVKYGFKLWAGRGKVMGEFVCDAVVVDKTFGHDALFNAAACMSETEAAAYCVNAEMYGWHISDLKIYAKPKPLSMFYKECAGLDNTGMCYECENAVGEECDCAVNGHLHLARPPQSWCYVEGFENA